MPSKPGAAADILQPHRQGWQRDAQVLGRRAVPQDGKRVQARLGSGVQGRLTLARQTASRCERAPPLSGSADLGAHEFLTLGGEQEYVQKLFQGVYPPTGKAGRGAPPVVHWLSGPRNWASDHVFFVNFTRWGKEPPAYVNLLRDPMARYVSQYAFWRAPGILREEMRRSPTPLAACAAPYSLRSAEGGMDLNISGPWGGSAAAAGAAVLPLPGVRPPVYGCPPHNYMTRYLCGHGAPCADPPDEATFLRAAQHLGRDYAFVGVLEQLPDSLGVLTAKFPGYFPNPAARGGRLNPTNAVAKKEALAEVAPDQLAAVLAANWYDWRLYVLARALLERHLAACGLKPAPASAEAARVAAALRAVATRARPEAARGFHATAMGVAPPDARSHASFRGSPPGGDS